MTTCTVEIEFSGGTEVLGRIVQVVSSRPFLLERLSYRRMPRRGRRRVVLDVLVDDGPELLVRRLNRIVAIEGVRVMS